MKIVHIVRQFNPAVGGLGASVLNLAQVQRSRLAIDASVVTLDLIFGHDEILPHEDIVAGIPVRRLGWSGSSRYPLAPSVLRHLRESDVVHVHAIDFFFDFLALTRPFHQRRMIASTHGGFFHSTYFTPLKKLWFNTISRASILAYHRIVACSHSDAALFQGLAGRRLRLIENGIDQARFANSASPQQNRIIMCFGRFAKHKRIAELFPLLAELRKSDASWRLIVAGRDADQTAEELTAFAKEAGVADAVSFIMNPKDAELTELIGKASYFACLSGYEGFGLAAVEAMSAGLFPILSDIPPFRRLIEQSKVGLIVDPAAPMAAAQAVRESVLDDPGAYEARRENIMDAVRRYDWEEVAARYSEIYVDAIGEKQGNTTAESMGSHA